MKTLTLALIAKNEQQVISRVLKNSHEFADQIVVVDTGSTDKTAEIAKKLGAEVYYFKWIDDFSAARNFAFEKAKCQYIMWLDADDVVSDQNAKKIVEWKKSPQNCDTLMAKYCTGFNDDGSVSFWFFRERILKNCPKARWEGRIHEAITPFGEVMHSDIEIFHKPLDSHTKRNLGIYRSMLRQNVLFNQRELYYYARELYYAGYFSKALATFKKFVKREGGYYIDKAEACKLMHTIYKIKGQPQKAQDCLLNTMKYIRPRSDIFCLLGDMFFEKNQLEKAVDFYKIALTCQSNEGFVSTEYKDFFPYMQLCLCYYRLGDIDACFHYHQLAQALKPTHPSILHNQKFFEKLNK